MSDGYRHKLRARLEAMRWSGRNADLRVLNDRQVGRLTIELEPMARSAAEAARLREALTEIDRRHQCDEKVALCTGCCQVWPCPDRQTLDQLHLDRLETRLKETP